MLRRVPFMATELGIDDRRNCILELLSVKGYMSLTEISRALEVSQSTVRRDLEVLEEQGPLRRTHGGAVYVKDVAGHRLAFADRTTSAAAEKQAIARAVAKLIAPGGALILNGGTTCMQVASEIAGRRLSVITNSVPIASLLSADLETEVTLVGGYVYPRTGVSLGTMAIQQLEKLHATQLVLSCAGLSPDGVFNVNQMMVDVERKMMEIARQVILAVDHTKLGLRAVARLADLDELDVIVTDAGLGDERRAWLESLKARIVIAPLEPRLDRPQERL